MLYSSLEILFRHRWRYLILLVVLPLIGALICIPLYPKSSASELVWVQNQGLINNGQPAYQQYLTPAQVTQGDFEQYIQTRAFAVAVYHQLIHRGLSADQAVSIVNGLSSGLVATYTGSNLLFLGYTCTEAASWVCPVALSTSWNVYEAYSVSSVNSQLDIAEKAYQQQVNQAQQQLDTANAAASTYLAAHPGVSQEGAVPDPTYSTLLQNVQTAQQALKTAQGSLAATQAQANTNQLSVSELYKVVDAAHSEGGHLSRLPTKQMMIVAALFWGLAAISLILTARLERVARHPQQLGAALGIEVVAVMQPIPAARSTLALRGRSRGAAA